MAADEMVDIINDDGTVIASIPRVEAEANNNTTQNVLVFVFNSAGEVLIQLRPQTKKHYPGMWDVSACGGLVSGEEPTQAAVRELQEETGLANVQLHHVETFMNVFPGDHGEERRRLSYVYVGKSDDIPKTSDEADEFRAWQPNELLDAIRKNPNQYVPSMAKEIQLAIKGYEQFFQA